MSTIYWHVGEQSYPCERLDTALCPMCGFMGAVVELPPPLKAQQTDGTTHVCHPGFGGCNHGFAHELDGGPDSQGTEPG